MLTRMTPSFAVAYCTSVHSATLGAQIPTRSPFPRPAASRPSATVSTSSRIWAYVQRRPLGTSTIASWSGWAATTRSKLSPMVSPSSGTSDVPEAYDGTTGAAADSAVDTAKTSLDELPPILRRSRPGPPPPGRTEVVKPVRPAPIPWWDARPPRPARSRHRRRPQAGPPGLRPGRRHAGEAALRAQRGDPARRRGPRGEQARGPVGEGRERRGAARAGRAGPRAEGRGHGRG